MGECGLGVHVETTRHKLHMDDMGVVCGWVGARARACGVS